MISNLNDATAIMGRVLESDSFEVKNEEFIRRRSDFFDCISVQLKSDGTAFAINLGVEPLFLTRASSSNTAKTFVREIDCYIRVRLAPHDKSDHWWQIGCTDEEFLTGFVSLYASSGKKFFEFFSTIQDSILVLSPQDIASGKVSSHFGKMTRVRLALLGAKANLEVRDLESARDLADYGLRIAGMAVGPKKEFKNILEQTGR